MIHQSPSLRLLFSGLLLSSMVIGLYSGCLVLRSFYADQNRPDPPMDSARNRGGSLRSIDSSESRVRLPLSFEENHGQAEPDVRFLARGSGYNLTFHRNSAELRIWQHAPPASDASPAVLRMKLIDANPSPKITGLDPQPGRVSYFTGPDPAKWHADLPTFAKVCYENVLTGIDLIYYGQQQQLEYDFIVAPGADPQSIRLAFEGTDHLTTDLAGNLLIEVAGHQVRQHRPVIYQEVNGVKRDVSGEYQITGHQQVSFAVGEYDRNRPLVIDPVLSYATFVGGRDGEIGGGFAVDSAGNMYVSGFTRSADFPTAEAQNGSLRGSTDAFVMKLNAAGNTLMLAAYFGGSAEDFSTDIEVNADGNIYFCGYTTSADLPTMNPLQAQFKGKADLFVAKLAGNGSLLFATYLGGSQTEVSTEMAVSGSGEIVLTGHTDSADFPLRNPFRSSFGGGICGSGVCTDAFIVRLNAAGNALVHSSFLGGSGLELGNGLALDQESNAYLTGMTSSINFPVKSARQASLAGGNCGGGPCADAFITKVDASGALIFSTYFGGASAADGKAVNQPEGAENGVPVTRRNPLPGITELMANPAFTSFTEYFRNTTAAAQPSDLGLGIALDAQASIYLTGLTGSQDLPVTNAAQRNYGGGNTDAFVAKFNPTATSLIYCTYLGGESNENTDNLRFAVSGFSHQCIAVDATGNACVTGTTISEGFPQISPLTPGLGADAFVTRFNSSGAITFSSYYGGSDIELGQSITVNAAGAIFLLGATASTDLATVLPLQSALRGEIDLFIARIDEGNNNGNTGSLTSVSAADYRESEVARESIVAAFGSELTTGIFVASTLPLPTSLGGTTLKIRDSAGIERPAPLFFVSPQQINYYVPEAVADGTATITVITSNGRVSVGTVKISPTVPGLFSANSTGQGVAAALIVRAQANGAQSYESVAQYQATQGKFVTLPIDLGADQGAATDIVTLVLFGTGIRYRQAVSVRVGSVNSPVEYAGITPGLIGLDQVNVRLPRTLMGSGEIPVRLTVDGREANVVTIGIR